MLKVGAKKPKHKTTSCGVGRCAVGGMVFGWAEGRVEHEAAVWERHGLVRVVYLCKNTEHD